MHFSLLSSSTSFQEHDCEEDRIAHVPPRHGTDDDEHKLVPDTAYSSRDGHPGRAGWLGMPGMLGMAPACAHDLQIIRGLVIP